MYAEKLEELRNNPGFPSELKAYFVQELSFAAFEHYFDCITNSIEYGPNNPDIVFIAATLNAMAGAVYKGLSDRDRSLVDGMAKSFAERISITPEDPEQ